MGLNWQFYMFCINYRFRYDVPFVVLRMLVVDYDYEMGKSSAERVGIGPWWDIISIMWLLLSAMIMLNLFIALMTDRLFNLITFFAFSCDDLIFSRLEEIFNLYHFVLIHILQLDTKTKSKKNHRPLCRTTSPTRSKIQIDILKLFQH